MMEISLAGGGGGGAASCELDECLWEGLLFACHLKDTSSPHLDSSAEESVLV